MPMKLVCVGTAGGLKVHVPEHQLQYLDTGGPLFLSCQVGDQEGNLLPVRGWLELELPDAPAAAGAKNRKTKPPPAAASAGG